MKIRPAAQHDIPSIFDIERAVFHGAVYPAFFFRQAFDLWPRFLFVAESEDVVAGYALAAPAEDATVAWILSLAVGESARGQGVGRHLLMALLNVLRERHFETVRLTVHPENPAIALYELAGFIKIGQEAHYFDEGEPRVLMELKLA